VPWDADETAGFSAADGGSRLANDSAFTRSSSIDGANVMIASGAVADMAGNSNSGISAGPYKIDGTPPTVICPSPAPVFVLGQTPLTR
jgi:hypothetical protein